jgi:hypothetical protein
MTVGRKKELEISYPLTCIEKEQCQNEMTIQDDIIQEAGLRLMFHLLITSNAFSTSVLYL